MLSYYISNWEYPRVYVLGHADVTLSAGTQPWKIIHRRMAGDATHGGASTTSHRTI